MEKYYIIASLKRNPKPNESTPVAEGAVYLGRIKAEVSAESWQEAMEIGKDLITTIIKPGVVAFDWSWMSVNDAVKLGDADIYAKYHTASWINYYRIKRGLTQRQLSNLSGVNIRQIQKIENGEIKAENTTAKNLLAIADALQVDMRALL